MLKKEIIDYVEKEIIPCYDNFDSAHSRSHVNDVIRRSQELAKNYDVDENMVYLVAAFHDTGLVEGRELHHIVSGKILMADAFVRNHFSDDECLLMAQAVEDHRASSKNRPRSVYGMIVAEADRIIDADITLRRTVQYGLNNCPGMTKDEQYERFRSHLMDKYAAGGYLKLWIEESDNARQLAQLRTIIEDEERLKSIFDRIYAEETAGR